MRTNITKNDQPAAAPAAAAPPAAPPAVEAAPPVEAPAPPAVPPTPEPAAKDTKGIDDALASIDTVLAQPATRTDFTAETFEKYVADQTAKAAAEVAAGHRDRAEKRIAALKASVAAAKAVLYSANPAPQLEAGGGGNAIPVYVDPWILLPTAPVDMRAGQPPTGPSNVQFPDVPAPSITKAVLRKSADGKRVTFAPAIVEALLISKAADTAKCRVELAKTEEGRTLVAKAGEARSILEKIQAMFAIELDEPSDLLGWELRCQVGDIIGALQNAAQVEAVMDKMAPMLDGGGADTVKAAAEAAAKAAKDAADKVAKSGDEVPWPMDLAVPETPEVVVDARDKVTKGAQKPYFGFDNEPAPAD